MGSEDKPSKSDSIRSILVLGIILILIVVLVVIIYYPVIVIWVSKAMNASEQGKKVEDRLFEKTQQGIDQTMQYFSSSIVPEEVIDNIGAAQGLGSDFYYLSSIGKDQILKIHRIYRYDIKFGFGNTVYRHTCVEYSGRPGSDVALTQMSVKCPTGGDFGTGEGEVSFDFTTETVNPRN